MDRPNILAAHDAFTIARRSTYRGLQVLAFAALIISLAGPPEYARPAAYVALAITALVLMVSVLFEREAIEELANRSANYEKAMESHHQIEELFVMTDMLQSAEEHDDAGAVLMATSLRLLPDLCGALYVFNNSRDRLDLVKCWNGGESFTPAETLQPSNCWALKRGKRHINDAAARTLCCMHQLGTAATLEVPMMARGAVYGLLVLGTDAENAYDRLLSVRRLGQALADSMSLALSNIALREKLRTQSLRDPLTGLYNRRYMEDALDRYVSLAERSGNPTSVLMIDLDNFKKLNDEYGHAKGDAVLRDVAGQLVGSLRPSDVVSRYGGEELMVILPDCGLDDAQDKAEMLRSRIEMLSESHGVPVSASFGVACVPDTSTNPADLVPMADNALYAAKQAGKNRVHSAERRTPREEFQPRLASG